MGESSDKAEIRLDHVLDTLQTGNQTQRTAAITDLRAFFDRSHKASNLNILSDKSYHRIYEVVFNFALVEKQHYFKSKEGKGRTLVANRLRSCADVVRIIVKTGSPKLRGKTVEAVVDHITQTLPTLGGEYFEPLTQHYMKALSVLFEHPANVESLKQDVWVSVVDFCLRAIDQYVTENDKGPSILSRSSSGVGGSPAPGSVPKASISSSYGSRRDGVLTRQNVEDAFQTLLFLISDPASPLSERYSTLAETTLRFLQLQGPNVGQVHQVAFSILNMVLLYTRADHSLFTQSIATAAVPVINRFWRGKAVAKDEMLNSVREEMLICLITIHPHLERAIRDDNDADILHKLEALLSILRLDYSKRSDRDQIQLDDLDMLDLGSDASHLPPLSLGVFRLKSHNVRAERNWGTLQTIGVFERLLTLGYQQVKPPPDEDGDKDDIDRHPSKRRRIVESSDRLVEPLESEDEKLRLSGLHALPFVLQEYQLPETSLKSVLIHLYHCASDKRENIASWALLAIASCAYQTASSLVSPTEWIQLWHIGCRSLTFPATCRAAAVQLHAILCNRLIQYRDIGEDINAIINSADSNGPAILCDSSALLMSHILHTRVTEVPGASLVSSQHVIRWLFGRWNPVDRYFISHNALHVQPHHITTVLRTCLGLRRMSTSVFTHLPGGSIAQAWLHHLDTWNTIRYILLLEDESIRQRLPCSSCPKFAEYSKTTHFLNTTHFNAVCKLIIELLQPKCEAIVQGLRVFVADRSSPLSSEVFRSALDSCLVMLMIMQHFVSLRGNQVLNIEKTLEEYSAELLNVLADPNFGIQNGVHALRDTLLQSVQPYLPPCGSKGYDLLAGQGQSLLNFFAIAAETVSSTHPASAAAPSTCDEDLMEIDDDFSIRQSQTRSEAHKAILPRKSPVLAMWSGTFSYTVLGRLMLLAAINNTPDDLGTVPSSFLDYILALSDEEVLSSRQLLQEVYRSDLVFDNSDAVKLMERLGTMLGGNFGRCEVMLGICLDALAGFEPLWSTSEDSPLGEVCSEIYQYFITKVLEKDVASPEVQKGIVELLLILLKTNTQYGEAHSIPSARSSLFKILETGNTNVRFFIGQQISQLFDLYILQEHDTVFVDLLEILPKDYEWIEAIALRLFVLAKLASSWPNLLRRCIYHIFETAGKVKKSGPHATRCLSDISSCLQVGSTRELFALFAPQVMFTWLESGDIMDIPFQIFGFSSLRELVENSQEEAAAVMLMRGQEEALQELSSLLEVNIGQLLQISFPKVMAYTIAQEIDSAHRNSTKAQFTGEVYVKKHLGSELFFNSTNLHFADIVCSFFNLLDAGLQVERQFERDGLKSAASVIKEIKSFGWSDAKLPVNQQPFFRAKYLVEQLEHLCSRTQHELHTLFTPALVTTIVRRLLNTITPALGSQHACSVLRKLRVLIGISGTVTTEGYPLRMLLQSLQPFLTNPECINDTVGMMQYLLKNGTLYLLQVPPFIAGLSLAILGSLRAFLDSQKANTTQESQHKLTLSAAQAFHIWLGQYLTNYNPPSIDPRSLGSFQELIQSALGAGPIGNADIDASEGLLLINILKDEQSGNNLLRESSRDLALRMLCSKFRGPASFRTDILGNDKSSIINAAVVWKSCRGSRSTEYLSWAARVLGRAFSASGHVHKELLLESKMAKIIDISGNIEAIDSRVCVLHLLEELTSGHNTKTVGLAETALRTIITSSDGKSQELFLANLPRDLFTASLWGPYQIPPSETTLYADKVVSLDAMLDAEAISKEFWLRDFSIALAQSVPGEPLLTALVPVLHEVPDFADQVFPFLIHLVLSIFYQDHHRAHRKELSKSCMNWLVNSKEVDKDNMKMLINSILYLRTQPLPDEKSQADRSYWLDIDYSKAAVAATQCGMFKTALLFVEEYCSQPSKSSRRSSAARDTLDQTEISTELLLSIFENIDDPDLYYGVQQKANLSTILARFEYEKDGPKSLAFRGAQYDSHIRTRNSESANDIQSLVKALDVLNLNALSHSLLQAQETVGMTATSLESLFRTARNLEQWDIPVPNSCDNNAVAIYKTFQSIHMASDEASIVQTINEGFEYAMIRLVREDLSARALHDSLQTLAALVEVDEILGSRGSEQFEELLFRFNQRAEWMKTGSFEDISQILSCRGTALSTLNQQPRLQEIIKVKPIDTRLVQVQTALLASKINRSHSALQESLSLATSMMELIKPCHEIGLSPEVAIHVEAASALWDQGEMASSIGMLQALDNAALLKKQDLIGRSNLLSQIGHRVSIARLEKADRVIEKYLEPALKELKGVVQGSEAGQVFHQFATFCDQQLQDPDGLEDLERLQKLSKNKSDEVQEYQKLIERTPSSHERSKYSAYLKKARNWLKLDDEELNRLKASREKFLEQCFQNYLLALAASDEHDGNALRFSALWLEHADETLANEAVSKHLNQVPSRKFARLMNQLTSRLQDNPAPFQVLLLDLLCRICTEHPYHGMYQIYAGANSRPSDKDESALSRRSATKRLVRRLGMVDGAKQIWGAIISTNKYYCLLAAEKDEQNYRTGKKIAVKNSGAATTLSNSFGRYKVPPPTMPIELSADLDYSRLPHVLRLESTMSIASGVSLPKIITLVASNGMRYRQLVKGGNDDLRQDAIMEQVFEQVSELLKTNRSTRQRNLSIRTYRVLPLTNIAGVIEFVANTVPLHEYLMPAHERYHPKDIKSGQCRKEIGDVQGNSVEKRIKAFKSVMERFRPVMRYFFTEKFNDPDTWFATRLAYTRSTAAISILGHVLGLGDRHGHNILLDTKSGEVVHIDLGVAFEMGRVLPVPELVPFRLTRDIVDGMGITKTEGVFRRCCEFTLEALRKEAYSIMTILDVLRYDPLYSWSITPVRLAKLQAGTAPEASEVGSTTVPEKTKEAVNEPGEADRALTVVNKKLSKTLSVTATVNDLINQASDERNLAVLYSGWAAYA